MSVEDAKNIIKADKAIYDRPEILSIDPGEGLRVTVDVMTLVRNGGSMQGYAAGR